MTKESGGSPWLDAAEIKSRVSIRDVLQRYGLLEQLKGTGDRLRGLSPFREETKPSFFVDLSKNVWNDFPRPTIEGKTVPGNTIGLTMAVHQIGFRDALLKLHEDFIGETRQELSATVDNESPMPPRSSGEVKAKRRATPSEAFGKELKGLRYEAPYLQEKGISPDRARYWGTGYCSRGMMKGRIVVPIRDVSGVIRGYAGRSLKDDDEDGKWKFPNGFSKSTELFGIERIANDDEAKAATQKYGLIVVEGFLDAICLAERGLKNTVAVMGTDISDTQLEKLLDPELNPTRRLTLFFDFDEPGREGRKRTAAKTIHEGFIRYVEPSRIDLGDRSDPDEKLDTFLRLHRGGLEYFGGTPRRVVYDNLKSVVLHHIGRTVQFNPNFLPFAGHYLFEPLAAPVRYPEFKGRVEHGVRYVKQSFYYGRTFRDWDDLRTQARSWLEEVANVRRHKTTGERPADRLLVEKKRLIDLPERPFDTDRVEVRVVRKDARVPFDGNHYSAPHTSVGKTIHVRADGKQVRFIEGAEVIATHKRSFERGQVIEDPKHAEALIERRKSAQPSSRRERLAALSDEARAYLQEVARRRKSLEHEVRQLLRLVHRYSESEVADGMKQALGARQFGARYVRFFIDQSRFARGLGEAPEPITTGNKRADAVTVKPHNLETYDALFENRTNRQDQKTQPPEEDGDEPSES